MAMPKKMTKRSTVWESIMNVSNEIILHFDCVLHFRILILFKCTVHFLYSFEVVNPACVAVPNLSSMALLGITAGCGQIYYIQYHWHLCRQGAHNWL